jgi:4-hydroxybenzoate polyprenyltransferase
MEVFFPDVSESAIMISLFVFFATLLEYNIHRFITLIRGIPLAPEPRFIWLYKHKTLFYSLFVLSIVGLSFTAFYIPVKAYPVIAITTLLTLLYNFPLIPTPWGLKRLRAIPHMKVITIALVWMIITYYLPAIANGVSFTDELLVPLTRFLFVVAITIPFDSRDVEMDRKRGLKTIPLVFGVKRSYQIAAGILVVTCFLCLFMNSAYGWALIITSAFTTIFILKEGWRSHPFYYYGVLDGTLLLSPLIHVLLSEYLIK